MATAGSGAHFAVERMSCPCTTPRLGSYQPARWPRQRRMLRGLGCFCQTVLRDEEAARALAESAASSSPSASIPILCIPPDVSVMPQVCAAPVVAAPVVSSPALLCLTTGTATISEPAGCAGNNQNPQYSGTPTVTLSGSDLSTVQSVIAQVQAGAMPTAPQGVGFITTVQPNYPTLTTVPSPSAGGAGDGITASARSNLSGLSLYRTGRGHGFGATCSIGLSANLIGKGGSLIGGETGAVLTDVAAGASVGAELGSLVIPIPGVGTVIGAAVGAVAGLVEGLFGRKETVPHVTAADIAQAQSWYAQYNAIATTTVGRNFTQSSIQDMITAEAILNPGFWGLSTSTQISIPDVTAFYTEVMKRVNDFLTAIAAAAVGATITIHDDPTILGHYPCEGTYHPLVTYTFVSPGINAPSYVLGPLFAQYFFTMCRIFDSASQCSGHLNPPMPQFYTDLIDFVRAAHAGWDTPQPNVIGVVASVVAPTLESCGSSIQSEIITPLCIPACELTQASATPGSVPPVVMVPKAVTDCGTVLSTQHALPASGRAGAGSSLSALFSGSHSWVVLLALGAGILLIARERQR